VRVRVSWPCPRERAPMTSRRASSARASNPVGARVRISRLRPLTVFSSHAQRWRPLRRHPGEARHRLDGHVRRSRGRMAARQRCGGLAAEVRSAGPRADVAREVSAGWPPAWLPGEPPVRATCRAEARSSARSSPNSGPRSGSATDPAACLPRLEGPSEPARSWVGIG
jgi:hypothetical protein